MLVAAGEAAPHMFVVILIIIAVSFFILSLRTPGTWRLWKEGHTTKQQLYSELFFVTDNWRLIREEKREDRAAASLKQAISDALVGEAPCTAIRVHGIWAKGIVTAVVYRDVGARAVDPRADRGASDDDGHVHCHPERARVVWVVVDRAARLRC